jgi:AraC-like DNA-binding protein
MAEMFPGTASTQNWLADAVRLYQLAADFRPANCAALYEHLADLAERTPTPRTPLDEMCARHLLCDACVRTTAAVMGDHFSRADSLLKWPSLWVALNLIGTTKWKEVAAGLRGLAHDNRDTDILPKRVEIHLRAHFADACRLSDLAHDMGTSPRVLTKEFRRQYNCTVHQFLSLLRLRAAVRLLEESDLKVSAIGTVVGYGSTVDLYRQLRRVTRLTPAAIRANRAGALAVLRTLDQWLSSHGLAA